jgi:phosphoglycerate dehydrogenase-like enzyme
MTIRIVQFVQPSADVLDEAFLRDFPGVQVTRARDLDALAGALDGAEILHVYNSAFTPAFAQVVRERGGALRWIQFTTVGIEIAVRAGLPRGVWVTNSGDVQPRVLASHALALMLGLMRGFRHFGRLQAEHAWPARHSMGSNLVDPDGARMVILGMGHVGQEIARKAKAFDMEVICVTRAPAAAVSEIDRVVPRERIGEVLPVADVVMVALPSDDSTRGFLSAERIGLMHERAILVNVSRGEVVDEAALARTLATGRIRGAGLDAFTEEPLPTTSPLWSLPNVLITPHVGGVGGDRQRQRMRDLIHENTRRYLSGEPLMHVVTAPDGTPPTY